MTTGITVQVLPIYHCITYKMYPQPIVVWKVNILSVPCSRVSLFACWNSLFGVESLNGGARAISPLML